MISPKKSRDEAGEFIKRRKRTASKVSAEANKQVDKHLVSRVQNFAHSWRFIVSWLLLSTLLIWVLIIQTRSLESYYTQLIPRDGGTYVEGIKGPLTNMNPIYATTSADQAVSRLLFASLMKYDENNQLVPDLAESLEADDKASIFTLTLKPDLEWHDGVPLTAQDIVYTIRTIQDPESRSPLRRSWIGVNVEAIDAQTVQFSLPGSFSPFPHLLTFGVLPRHILQEYSATQLRSASFNSSEPIGSGPFEFQRIVNISGAGRDDREIKVQLIANTDYHLATPKLDAFTFWVAPESDRLTDLFNTGQLSGVSDVNTNTLELGELSANERIFSQTSGVYLFFKTTNVVLEDPQLRSALAKAINVNEAVGVFERPVRRIYGPLLNEQLGFTTEFAQVTSEQEQAIAELDALGWVAGGDGIRTKDGVRLSFTITSQRDTEYQPVVESIVSQFREIGIDAQIDLRDLEGFAENVLRNHVYSDMLVYGINIGADPDVYSFWHSSQADENSTVRLNLSEYNSEVVDEALEGGRSRVEEDVRALKYEAFQEAWSADTPAVALYRTQFVYYELKNIRGPRGAILRNQIDRFRDITEWTVLTERVEYEEGRETLN